MAEKSKLTGYQRFQLTLVWLKRKDMEETFEDFVKKVCDAKGIEYGPPKPHERK